MDNWKIKQTINLQKQMREQFETFGLASVGDRMAHTWEVTVLNGSSPADISGASVIGFFRRKDGVTVPAVGKVTGNVASVTLPAEAYVIDSTLSAILRITKNYQTVTMATARFIVGQNISGEVVNPGNIIPNIDDLIIMAGRLDSALSDVEAAIAFAMAMGANADAAAAAAYAVTAKWQKVAIELKMLPPDGSPAAWIKQTANQTTFGFELPQARVTNATLYMNDSDMTLWQRMPVTPEVGIDYYMDPDTTELFQRAHGY